MSQETVARARISLGLQVLAIIIIAAFALGSLLGNFARSQEEQYLRQNLEKNVQRTLRAIANSIIDSVIAEDQPVLETTVEQLANNNPDIINLEIKNESGLTLARRGTQERQSLQRVFQSSVDITLAGEKFGSITLKQTLDRQYREIEKHVSRIRRLILLSVLGLGLLLLLLLQSTLLRPIEKIIDRLKYGDLDLDLAGKGLLYSRELAYLDQSVSERLQVDRDLKNALEKSKAANKAKSQFLANMSHELRTPLNGIMSLSQLLIMSGLDQSSHSDLCKIQECVESLTLIINDILDFSKIEAGKMELEEDQFELSELIDRLSRVLGARASENEVSLKFDVDVVVPQSLIGDVLRLEQILNNLIGNAIKFTEKDGEIAVSVCLDREEEDEVKLHWIVSDTGIGISPEKRESIFNIFEQADNSVTREYGGTGLGLAIVKHLVEMMGGTIWLESAPGTGSHFHFTICLRTIPISSGCSTTQEELGDIVC